jgi:hypothetical protein
MRIAYNTDADDAAPEYWGAFSQYFPGEKPDHRIVDVDWSVRGEVVVTWLVTG